MLPGDQRPVHSNENTKPKNSIKSRTREPFYLDIFAAEDLATIVDFFVAFNSLDGINFMLGRVIKLLNNAIVHS